MTAFGRTTREFAAELSVLLFLFWDIWPAHDRSFGESAGLPGPCMTELLRISVRLRVFAVHLLIDSVEIVIWHDRTKQSGVERGALEICTGRLP